MVMWDMLFQVPSLLGGVFMTFDIFQVFEHNHLFEEKTRAYQNQLVYLFEQSPEGQALFDEDNEPCWASMMMDYGADYFGCNPPQMSSSELHQILFNIFPRKVSASADEAPAIIHELQAFWRFLQRE